MGSRLLKIVAIVVLAGLGGVSCATIANLADPVKPVRQELKPIEYAKDGLSFTYPEGWRVSADERASDGFRDVFVKDDYATVVSFSVAPDGQEFDLEKAARGAIEGLSKEMPVGTISEIKESKVFTDIAGLNRPGIKQRFGYTLAGINVPHTADNFVIELGGRSIYIRAQAADEDLPAAEKEIRMVLDGFKLSDLAS